MNNQELLKKLKDAQLVSLARQGNRSAYGELVLRHRQRCMDLASCILRNHGDAEDEVQNAFIKGYEHLDQYQNEAEFSTWLARIVSNQCLMRLRVRHRTRFVYLDDSVAEPEMRRLEVPAPGPDPEGDLGATQVVELLRQEMRRIPPLMRDVIHLRDVQQLSMMDVAARLGITVPAAKSRLLRARKELRSRITERHAWMRATPSPLSRVAAPLARVGRHYPLTIQ